MQDEAIRLNLGAGDKPLPGYLNLDRKNGQEVFPLPVAVYSADGDIDPLTECSVDEVRASHVLEHFSHRQTLDVLKEWVRVLKPGGVLKVAVPNFDYIVNAYANDESGLPLEGYLFGGHVDDDDKHGAMFNEQKLRALMRMAGLSGIRPWKSETDDCASLPVSLNLMGTKAAPVEKLSGVHAVLSAPRLGFTEQFNCMIEAVNRLKLPTRIRQGVFWGQTLTAALEECIAEGAEFILTHDYDTIATPDDVVELYRLMRDNPDADAIFAAQVGRDRDTLLMTIKNEEGTANRRQLRREELDAELLPASTGHFGLTMLRASALKALPRPWFHHQPDADGRWGENRVDEDIWFWRRMEEAGRKVYQASHVVIGHLQLVATWPSVNLTPIHQYVGDWRKSGKPQGVLT